MIDVTELLPYVMLFSPFVGIGIILVVLAIVSHYEKKKNPTKWGR